MLYDRLEKLCTKHGTTPTALCKKITKSTGNLATWKNGNARNDHLVKIAQEFEVSIDYLLGNDDIPHNTDVTYSEKEMYTFPVIGAISAGYDGDSEFSPTGEELLVPKHLLKTHHAEDYFVLEVKGNSMYPLFSTYTQVRFRRQRNSCGSRIQRRGRHAEKSRICSGKELGPSYPPQPRISDKGHKGRRSRAMPSLRRSSL